MSPIMHRKFKTRPVEADRVRMPCDRSIEAHGAIDADEVEISDEVYEKLIAIAA